MSESERPSRPRAWRGPAVALAVVAIVAPQLLGGATDATALAIQLMAGAACAVVALQLRAQSAALGQLPALGLGAFGVALWTLVQALPLPCEWVGWAQAERRELAQELLALGAIQAERCSLSAAPGATLTAFAQAAVLAALFAAAVAASRTGGRHTLQQAVAASSILMALTALGHWALSADAVFGLYEPVHIKPRLLMAPLLNENHLAGHLALGFPLCVALGMAEERTDRRVSWFVGAFLVFSTGLLSLSRGGAVALTLSGGLFLVHQIARRRSERRGRSSALWLIAVPVCMALGAHFAYDLLAAEFEAEEQLWPSKFWLVRDLLPLMSQHPLAGVGRGALEFVSPSVLLKNMRAFYTENLPSQWLIEWGIPATLGLTATLAMSVARWSWRRAPSTEVALGCGLFALGAHNLVDFSLELPGLACTAAIACGCFLARERPRQGASGFSLGQANQVLATVAVAAALFTLPWLTVWSQEGFRARIEQAQQQHPEEVPDLLRAALRTYPLEPAFVVLGAQAAAYGNRPNVGKWLNLAMRVAPGWAGPHLLAAHVLERRGALSQAALELSLAALAEPWPATQHACDFVRRHPDADLAWTAANPTSGDERLASLEYLAGCLATKASPEQVEQFAERILQDYPESVSAHIHSITAGRRREGPELALSRARRMVEALPHNAEAHARFGQELLAAGRTEEVVRLVDAVPPALRNEPSILWLEASAAARLGQRERVDQVVERLLTRHGRTASARADLHRKFASLRKTQGNLLGALSHAQTAYDLSNRPEDLEQVHKYALEAGAAAVALRTASELCQLRHGGDSYCRRGASQTDSP
jgi:hypothetical protein